MLENTPNKMLALILLAGAQFLVILDATIVNVALPSIEKALHFSSAAQLQWIVTAYTLVFGGFLLLGGRMADLVGRRRVFLSGIILFVAASFLAGLAQNPAMIIAFRAIQGLGAALLSPAALSLVLSIFKEGKERNRALGVWSGVAAGGGAVGLLLGGLLTQYVDWRWIFFINVPIGMAIIFFARRYVPSVAPKEGNRVLDVFGAVTVTAGLMTLVYAFVKAAEYGWDSTRTIGTIAGALILLIIFVVNELRIKQPLIDMSIFKKRTVLFGNLMQLPVTAGMLGTFFYLSIYMQQILHYSPSKAGFASLPFTFFIALTAGLISRFISKVPPKLILVIAPLFTASGLFYFSHIPVDGHYLTDILPGIALMASGMGATFVAITLVATSGISPKQSGLASGLLNTSQQVGGALGLGILTSLSTSHTKDLIVAAHGNPAAIPAASVSGFDLAFTVAAWIVIGASVIALIGLENKRLTAKEIKDEYETEAETFPVVPGV